MDLNSTIYDEQSLESFDFFWEIAQQIDLIRKFIFSAYL